MNSVFYVEVEGAELSCCALSDLRRRLLRGHRSSRC